MPHLYIKVKQIKARFPESSCKLKLMLRAKELQSATIQQIDLLTKPVLLKVNEVIKVIYCSRLQVVRMYLLVIGDENRVINIGSVLLDLREGEHQIQLNEPSEQEGFVTYDVIEQIKGEIRQVQEFSLIQSNIDQNVEILEKNSVVDGQNKDNEEKNSCSDVSNRNLTDKLSQLAAFLEFEDRDIIKNKQLIDRKSSSHQNQEMQEDEISKILLELERHKIKNIEYRQQIIETSYFLEQNRVRLNILKYF